MRIVLMLIGFWAATQASASVNVAQVQQGRTTLVAHSLGNIVACQGVQAGFTPAHFYLLNAALPLEAIAGESVTHAYAGMKWLASRAGLMVYSLLLACQQVLPAMVERGRGSIIAISSIAGMRYLGYPHLAYGVTKAAVTHFTRMVAQQYAGQGVRANTVVPGLIDTPRIATTVAKMFSDTSLDEARAARARQVPMGRMGTAWDVAHACAFLASDAAAYVTGTELVVDGGITGKFV